MPQLRRILQEAWRRSRDQWRSLRRVQCVEWKRPLDRSDSQCGPSAVSLSANTFLRCHDDWVGLAGPEAAETFSEIVEAEKDATHNFFEQRGKPGKQAQVLEKLQAEAVSLLPNEEVIPEAQGHYMYFQRPTIDGYIQFGRYPKNQPEAEEVILDTSVPAEDTGSGIAASSSGSAGSGFTDLLACKVSDDHDLLAYIVDAAGDDSFELYLRPLAGSGRAGTLCVPGIRSVEFIGQANKNVVNLLAVRTDDTTKRAKQVLHLTMAGGSVTERLLWEEQNPAAYLELFRTKNRRFILGVVKHKRHLRCTVCPMHGWHWQQTYGSHSPAGAESRNWVFCRASEQPGHPRYSQRTWLEKRLLSWVLVHVLWWYILRDQQPWTSRFRSLSTPREWGWDGSELVTAQAFLLPARWNACDWCRFCFPIGWFCTDTNLLRHVFVLYLLQSHKERT